MQTCTATLFDSVLDTTIRILVLVRIGVFGSSISRFVVSMLLLAAFLPGTFGPLPAQAVSTPLSFAPSVSYSAAAGARGLAFSDFNHDGKIDLVVTNTIAGHIPQTTHPQAYVEALTAFINKHNE